MEVSYFLHCTEDAKKVNSAVAELVAPGARMEEEGMVGHFGNPIVAVTLRLHGDDALVSLQGLVARLPRPLRVELAKEIDKHVDEHSALYLRLDKQELVQGRVKAGSVDVVRIRVKPRAFAMKGRAKEFFVETLAGK